MRIHADMYLDVLGRLLRHGVATDAQGMKMPLHAGIDWSVQEAKRVQAERGKVMFIGNGGSAGICSHMAVDFLKNGRIPATAFNDAAMLTCLANDLGYEQVFAEPIAMHARAGDLLIAISSSGCSPNILNGVKAAREQGCAVLTLSGFRADNPLRRMGDRNLWVNSSEYGFVEITHLTYCHAILDLAMGWSSQNAAEGYDA